MEKITKDPKRMKAACKGREKYMNKLKEIILNDAKKGSRDTTSASNETTNTSNETTNASNETASATNTATPHPQAQDLMSMVLVHLLSLPLVFAYILHILKLKNKPMKKNEINQQNDFICFRSEPI